MGVPKGVQRLGTGVGAVMGDIVSLVLDEPSSCLGSRGSCCARIAMLYDSGVTLHSAPWCNLRLVQYEV